MSVVMCAQILLLHQGDVMDFQVTQLLTVLPAMRTDHDAVNQGKLDYKQKRQIILRAPRHLPCCTTLSLNW